MIEKLPDNPNYVIPRSSFMLDMNHIEKKTTEFKCWCGMISRCYNSKDAGYSNYGGRGITICYSWRLYSNFLKDMGRRPIDKHSIDRKDNDGPYSPENCRWATHRQQANNQAKRHAGVRYNPKSYLYDVNVLPPKGKMTFGRKLIYFGSFTYLSHAKAAYTRAKLMIKLIWLAQNEANLWKVHLKRNPVVPN